MRSVTIESSFSAWRDRARDLLRSGVSPGEILWEDGTSGAGSLFGDSDEPDLVENSPPVRIPKAFVELAQLVACHRDSERWGVLYRVAWRLTLGGERHLLNLRTDGDLQRLENWASAVRRDRHKMKAFVRFRKVGETEGGREQFVAWFEPESDIVELTAPFFAKRFAGMDWSILTGFKCAHWNGESLQFTPGVTSKDAPGEDQLDDYWRSYYSHIFNPARLKLKAMQSEMPKKYWKNLPEAPLIAELTRQASTRAIRMMDAPDSARSHVSERLPKGIPERMPRKVVEEPVEILKRADLLGLDEIRSAASGCRACDLCERATQVVFGAGAADAEIMVIGEQPGDAEDLRGSPFVGPSGRLLDRALSELGVERDQIYVTNVVKHFKWKRQGRIRLHQNPSAGEVEACKPWVLAEILKVRPRAIVILGASAAKALIRADFSITQERGVVNDCELAERVVATLHPSYLLRMKNSAEQERAYHEWVRDLRLGAF